MLRTLYYLNANVMLGMKIQNRILLVWNATLDRIKHWTTLIQISKYVKNASMAKLQIPKWPQIVHRVLLINGHVRIPYSINMELILMLKSNVLVIHNVLIVLLEQQEQMEKHVNPVTLGDTMALEENHVKIVQWVNIKVDLAMPLVFRAQLTIIKIPQKARRHAYYAHLTLLQIL